MIETKNFGDTVEYGGELLKGLDEELPTYKTGPARIWRGGLNPLESSSINNTVLYSIFR